MSIAGDETGEKVREDWLDSEQAAVIAGPKMIETYRLTVLRIALGVEITTGMKRSNRGPSTLALVNRAMGSGYKRKREAYEAFDAWLVQTRGMRSRPFREKRESK